MARANSTKKQNRGHSPRRVQCNCLITCTHEGGGVKTETHGARSMKLQDVLSQACTVAKPETAPQGTGMRPCLFLVLLEGPPECRRATKPYTLHPTTQILTVSFCCRKSCSMPESLAWRSARSRWILSSRSRRAASRLRRSCRVSRKTVLSETGALSEERAESERQGLYDDGGAGREEFSPQGSTAC